MCYVFGIPGAEFVRPNIVTSLVALVQLASGEMPRPAEAEEWQELDKFKGAV